jgi:hypothetical protein
MSTIICNQCGIEIEVTAALQGQIEQQVLAAEHKKHQAELARVKAEAEADAKQERQAAQELLRKKLEGERSMLMDQAKADLEIAKQRVQAQLASEQKKHAAQSEMLITSLKDDAAAEKQNATKLREQLTELMQTLRAEKQARADAELNAQKKLAEEEAKSGCKRKDHYRPAKSSGRSPTQGGPRFATVAGRSYGIRLGAGFGRSLARR